MSKWRHCLKCPECGVDLVWDYLATVPHYRCRVASCGWHDLEDRVT